MLGYSAAEWLLTQDDPCIVYAALACPYCLSGKVDWRLELVEHDDRARCRCRTCERRYTVYLSAQRALRLAVLAGHRRDAALASPAGTA